MTDTISAAPPRTGTAAAVPGSARRFCRPVDAEGPR